MDQDTVNTNAGHGVERERDRPGEEGGGSISRIRRIPDSQVERDRPVAVRAGNAEVQRVVDEISVDRASWHRGDRTVERCEVGMPRVADLARHG